MGTPSFAVPILKSIYQNGYEIVAVYTQPAQKSHRGMRLTKSPVNLISETLSLEVRTPANLKNNSEEYEYLKNLNVDLALVVAYGQIIPEEFLSLSKKLGFFSTKPILNFLTSFLPNDLFFK